LSKKEGFENIDFREFT
jgi:hypothetical protein